MLKPSSRFQVHDTHLRRDNKEVKIALVFVGVLVALVVAVAVAGSLLPRQHSASHSVIVRGEPWQVYALIRDFESAPVWRKELSRVERLSPTGFREHGRHGTLTYEVVEEEPGKRLVTRIADPDLSYSGSWTYEVESAPGGTTRVTITENGEIPNPIFRFVAKYLYGHTRTMENYLAALQKRFP